MRIALEDLGLDRLAVLYPGERRYALGPRADVVSLAELAACGARALYGAGARPPRPRRRNMA
ncbi:MAG: hypothetical protein HY812_04035 [Planctomycetes bacterium]|nr:hypothetical protein [Planctomycetota bacterium]